MSEIPPRPVPPVPMPQYQLRAKGFQFALSGLIDRKFRSGNPMQPDLLETFLDLVDTRSFNRTAERL
ncbi:MAG: hypothetical protein ACK446_08615, partial [Rhodobacterales bacterium]